MKTSVFGMGDVGIFVGEFLRDIGCDVISYHLPINNYIETVIEEKVFHDFDKASSVEDAVMSSDKSFICLESCSEQDKSLNLTKFIIYYDSITEALKKKDQGHPVRLVLMTAFGKIIVVKIPIDEIISNNDSAIRYKIYNHFLTNALFT